MRKILLLILMACLGLSCTRPMIAAFGSNSEIVIITSPRCRDQAETLKSVLEREILTVQYEKAYEVRVVSTAEFKGDRNRKNIVLMDYFRPEGDPSLTRTILGLAGRDKEAFAEGRLNLKAIHDRWAKGQVLILIAAPGQPELDDLLAGQADSVFDFVAKEVQTRLNRAIFHAGEQEGASARLAETYGWSLRLPTGYDIDETYASQRAIKILKDKPARMITVYWEGGEWPDAASTCLDRKKMLAWEFWDQDEVVEDGLKVDMGSFLGHESTVLSGTWENKKYTIGGIFATYCFTCDQCGRNYVIDASTFAPGLEKLPLMRELQAILVTFTCQHPTRKQ